MVFELLRGLRDRRAPEVLGSAPHRLRVLSPKFVHEDHGPYVRHLTEALDQPSIRNIAVTGRYGAGKSSLLRGFADQPTLAGRTLFLALSSLGPAEGAASPTNHIEKELVKQLLHFERPSRLNRSRYRRTEARNLARSIPRAMFILATGIGLAIAVAWLFGVDALPERLESPGLREGAAVSVVGLGATAALVALGELLRTRVISFGLSSNVASLTLEDDSRSYFDEYFDEIVYFFDAVSEIDIVVFEDLDRFDDPGIFEQLRELNTLLNSSRQLATRRRPWRRGSNERTIRFVYALRDSVFEQLGSPASIADQRDGAQREVLRANRTKFFDLVIPVVPFITHRNARDLLNQLLDECDDSLRLTPELVDLVARHLPDMRALRNLTNEFEIFAHRLIVNERGTALLEPDQLFALLAYKAVHLGDFEQILLGTSNLDGLYKDTRTLISATISARRRSLVFVGSAASTSEAVQQQVDEWAALLEWLVQRESAARGMPLRSYTIGASNFEPSDCRRPEFWQALFTEEKRAVTLQMGQPNVRPQPVPLSSDDLAMAFGQSLDSRWQDHASSDSAQQSDEIEADIKSLRTADFVDLAHRTDPVGDAFAALVTRYCHSDLARDLIAGGHIDRNFGLYVAEYYGVRVSPNVLTFLVRHVDTNTPDYLYNFADRTETAALIREARPEFFTERCAFNIDILDHLLDEHPDKAEIVLRSAAKAEPPSGDFLATYLANGERKHAAVAALAPLWPALFTAIARAELTDPGECLHLLDAALSNATATRPKRMSKDAKGLLHQYAVDLPTLGRHGAPPEHPGLQRPTLAAASKNIIGKLVTVGVVFSDLKDLSDTARAAIAEAGCFEISASVLQDITGQSTTPSLDALSDGYPPVYEKVKGDLDGYITALKAPLDSERSAHGRASVREPDRFVEILGEVEASGATEVQIDNVVALSAPVCTTEYLHAVPNAVWPSLAQHNRAPATLENIDAYVIHYGIDHNLATLLAAQDDSISLPTAASEESEAAVNRLTAAFLTAGTTLTPERQLNLVTSLEPTTPISMSLVDPENQELLPHLISEGLCSDDLPTFEHFAPLQPVVLLAAAHQSVNLTDFIKPALMTAESTAAVLSSGPVPLKETILTRHDEFLPSTIGPEALLAAGNAALAAALAPTQSLLQRIAHETNDAALVQRLLHKFAPAYTTDEVLTTLAAVGSRYGELLISGAEVQLPWSSELESVLLRLRSDGRVKYRKPSRKRKSVKVTMT